MCSPELRLRRLLSALLSLAVLALLSGSAVAAFGSGPGPDGGDPADLLVSATQALGRGDAEAAFPLAQQAVYLAPGNPEGYYLLGLAYQALARENEAEQALGKAVQLGPSVPWYHFALGSAYRRTGKENLALAEFLTVLRLEPSHPAAHYQAGELLADQGSQEEAVRHWNEALAIMPTFTPALKSLGQYHYAAGRLDAAIDFWLRASAGDPYDSDLWWRLATALSGRNRGDDLLDAVWAFRQFRNLAPPGADKALLQQADRMLADNADKAAQRYVAKGVEAFAQPNQAELFFRRALDLRPDLAPAHYNLGLALQRAGRYEEAVTAYLRAASLAPDQAAVHANLGTVYLALGRPFQAEKELRRAQELAPEDPSIRLNLAVALWKQGSPGEGRAALQALLAEDGRFAPAYYNLACLEASAGRPAEALAALRQAVALDGRYREVAARDPDLASLRQDPGFAAVLGAQQQE